MKSEKNDKKSDGKKCSSKSHCAATASKNSQTPCECEPQTGNEKVAPNEQSAPTLYRQVNLSVSRIRNGIQTDVRIHHETGKPTDIYVSQGDEAWTLTPDELDQLPKPLEEEVKALLTPEYANTGHSRLKFGADEKKEKKKLRS